MSTHRAIFSYKVTKTNDRVVFLHFQLHSLHLIDTSKIMRAMKAAQTRHKKKLAVARLSIDLDDIGHAYTHLPSTTMTTNQLLDAIFDWNAWIHTLNLVRGIDWRNVRPDNSVYQPTALG